MKVYIDEKIIELENKELNIENLFEEIDKLVLGNNKVFSHLIIDGLEIYENHYDYIEENLDFIEEVKVISLTNSDLINDTLVTTMDYVIKVQPILKELGEAFYKNPKNQQWNDLSDFLGGVMWILNTFSSIDSNKELVDLVSSHESWNLYVKDIYELKDIIVEFEEGILNKDNIMIGDILSYEILPIFESMEESLINILKVEVKK